MNSAHRSPDSAPTLSQHFTAEWQPTYSSPFNCQGKSNSPAGSASQDVSLSHMMTLVVSIVSNFVHITAETVWAQLKREYFVRFNRRESDFVSMDQFRLYIKALYTEVPLNMENLLRANRIYVDFHLRLHEQMNPSVDSYESSF